MPIVLSILQNAHDRKQLILICAYFVKWAQGTEYRAPTPEKKSEMRQRKRNFFLIYEIP